MHPYRSPDAAEPPRPERSRLARLLTRARRRLALLVHWRERRERILLRTMARHLHSYPPGFQDSIRRAGVSLAEIRRFGDRNRIAGLNLERVMETLGRPSRAPIVPPAPVNLAE